VLRHIVQARARGLGVILITHNASHAYPVGDRFLILDRGRLEGTYNKAELPIEKLVQKMGGGEELSKLTHELESYARAVDTGAVPIEEPTAGAGAAEA